MSDAPSTDDLGSMATLLGQLARTDDVAVLAPGTLVAGQYRIERKLGSGGMGVVYLAHDERLDRTVAVKLGLAMSPDMLRRLEREAQALARLSHPNVVTVFQVGELGGRAFIVMEHVAAGTARAWCDASPRTWREIVDLYLGAGAGLAAAHAAGLIHRDFKPDNVLVGDDGRPRVADFGLARASAEVTPPTPDVPGTAMTLTGAVMGTPAYMPPEQLAGDELDARADQFAFCASLWEALHGSRPFDGATPAEVRSAIEDGAPAGGQRARGLPRTIERVLRRGLSPHRDQRWRDLPALLAALRRGRGQRRRRLVAAGGAAVVAVAATAVVVARPASVDPCADSESRIAVAWNPARSEAIARRVHPADWPRVRDALDEYARRWAIGHRDACRATRVARSQTEAMFDRRDVCLARIAAILDVTVSGLERATPVEAARADERIGMLPDLAACAAVGALGAEDPPPSDPQGRAALLIAIRAVAEADGLATEGHDLEVAAARAEQALAQARAVGWRPEIARALVARARTRWARGDFDRAIVELREASSVAIAAHSDATAAGALADLARNLGNRSEFAEAGLALDIARAIVARGAPLDIRLETLEAGVSLASNMARYDDALAMAREMVQVAEAGSPRSRAEASLKLEETLAIARRYRDAVTEGGRTIALLEAALGPDHPRVAEALASRAAAHRHLGADEDAATDARRAMTIIEARLGAESTLLLRPLSVLADIAMHAGRRDEVIALGERSVAIAERNALSGSRRALPLINLAIFEIGTGDHRAGLARLERAVPLLEAELGADDPQLTDALIARGYALRGLGEHGRARAEFERAATLAAAGFGPTSFSATNARYELASTHLAAGDPAAAIAVLVPLVAVIDANPDERPPSQTIEVRLGLASARWAAGDRAAARRLAGEAASLAGEAQPGRAMVEHWRADHR